MDNITLTKKIVASMIQFFVTTLEGKTNPLFIEDWEEPRNPEPEYFISRSSFNAAVKETIKETIELLEDNLK